MNEISENTEMHIALRYHHRLEDLCKRVASAMTMQEITHNQEIAISLKKDMEYEKDELENEDKA